jgi:hypothetical protein
MDCPKCGLTKDANTYWADGSMTCIGQMVWGCENDEFCKSGKNCFDCRTCDDIRDKCCNVKSPHPFK